MNKTPPSPSTPSPAPNSHTTQYTTFHSGHCSLRLDTSYVQEIHRNFELPRVPLGQACVHDVMNLRDEVVTVLDHRNLASPPSNLPIIEAKLIRGGYQQESSLVMLIDPKEILAASLSCSNIRIAA